MKSKVLFFFILFLSFMKNSLAQDKVSGIDCSLTERKWNFFNGQMSDYWAQEYIGVDLFKEEFRDFLKDKPPPQNFIAVLDGSGGMHRVYVENLISGSGKQAILPRELISKRFGEFLFEVTTEGRFNNSFPDILKNFSFINNSMFWDWFDYPYYKKISSRKSVVVTISGNQDSTYPFLSPLKEEAVKEGLNSFSYKG